MLDIFGVTHTFQESVRSLPLVSGRALQHGAEIRGGARGEAWAAGARPFGLGACCASSILLSVEPWRKTLGLSPLTPLISSIRSDCSEKEEDLHRWISMATSLTGPKPKRRRREADIRIRELYQLPAA